MTTLATNTAFWITEQREVGYRDAPYKLQDGNLDIQTLFTGISRGTEKLVYLGQVPKEEHATMRAPYQDGDFSFPLKYGYSAVGTVQNTDRRGEIVFALFPHQSRFQIPATAALPVPKNVPSERAILAANMETALNIVWDAKVSIGDRVVVVGCGVVGALAAYLVAKIPGTEVFVVDIDPTRKPVANALGCVFTTPDTAHADVKNDADVLINASANAAGLSLAISLAGAEATIVEASWYGSNTTQVPLGGRFHRSRLQIVSSQVGQLPSTQKTRWSFSRRLTMALSLLDDPALDILISGETAFEDLAAGYHDILFNPSTLCHRVRYDSTLQSS